MKNIITVIIILSFHSACFWGQYSITTDTILPIPGELPEGYYTLRIYVSSPHSSDAVNAVVGSNEYPLTLKVYGGSVWNHSTFGGAHSGQINCNLQTLDATQRYDSFVTIGDTCGTNNNTLNVVEDPATPSWLFPFFQPNDSASSEISIDSPIGGGWFVTGENDSYIMGSDLKVLIAQITTNGTLCGMFNIQIADSSGINTLHTGLLLGPEVCGGTCNLISEWWVQQPDCDGYLGSVQALPIGGYAPFIVTLNDIEQSEMLIDSLSPGIYLANIEDAFGCTYAETITLIDVDPIVISQLMALPIGNSPGGNTTYDIEGGTPPYSISWSGPNGFNSSDINLPPLTDENQIGEYFITVTDSNGCLASQSLIITPVEEWVEVNYAVYPNPSWGLITLEGAWSDQIEIQDLSGRSVPFHLSIIQGIKKQLRIEASPGMYFLKDITKNANVTIIVQ